MNDTETDTQAHDQVTNTPSETSLATSGPAHAADSGQKTAFTGDVARASLATSEAPFKTTEVTVPKTTEVPVPKTREAPVPQETPDTASVKNTEPACGNTATPGQVDAEPRPRHWVLLRGLSRDGRHWETFPEQLQRLFPQDRVTCLNLPGTGTHHQLSSPATIGAIVDWLRQHYASSLTQPIHLLSISMGGMITADWMHRFPGEVAAGVMINTSSRLNPIYERMYLGTLGLLCSTLLTSMKRRERTIVQRTSNHHPSRMDLTKRWSIYQQQQPVAKSTILKQMFAASRFTPPTLCQPLLLLASRQDRVVNPKCSESLAKFWHADLRIHKSAGHDIPLDDSEWILSQLQSWVVKRPVIASATGSAAQTQKF
ncbi:alpha/beta hydrolase [Aestuariicella hydrocarbonica]|uniref:Alpha/beta hydrolase n=1 Tax=Pseudomaricurvus hydrocarbonicus TaxID=1470433 RepID=A0A9E5JU19_9GAMM|nr:alpha/beta hydrolase [Aestuariicella hydrocarbonica]NHO64885.1 alpha/beta hydrolase [Aestuariicella hydrocarbonica]